MIDSKTYYYLYKITSPSGNVYIGQTKNLKKRFYSYKNLSCIKQHILLNSLKKYGWELHKKETIYEGYLTKNQINQLERNEISYYKYLKINLNICDGGEVGPAYKGEDHPASRPVIQLDLNGKFINEWANARIAAESLGLDDASSIRIAINLKRFYSKGYFWIYKTDYELNPKIEYKPYKHLEKEILQFDMRGQLVNTYESIVKAAKDLNKKRANIGYALDRPMARAYGYYWITKGNYENGARPVLSKRSQISNTRSVAMYDKNNFHIKTFSTLIEASKESGMCRSQIRKHCQGKIKNIKNIYFRYN